MPRVGSEQYIVTESPASATSANNSDTKFIVPQKKSIGAWISVETGDARITFNGDTPGASDAPGIVIPFGAMPAFYPFPFDPEGRNALIKFRANGGTASRVSVIFVQ